MNFLYNYKYWFFKATYPSAEYNKNFNSLSESSRNFLAGLPTYKKPLSRVLPGPINAPAAIMVLDGIIAPSKIIPPIPINTWLPIVHACITAEWPIVTSLPIDNG